MKFIKKSHRYLNYLKQVKGKILVLFFLMILTLLLNLSLPQYIREYLDKINLSDNYLFLIASLFIATVILRLLFSIMTSYTSENVGRKLSNKLCEDLTKHCINLDMSFHNSNEKGSLIERIDSDVTFLGEFLSTGLVGTISSVLVVLGITFILFLVNPLIFLATILPNLLIVILLISLHKMAVPSWSKAKKTSAEVYSVIQENLKSREDIYSRNASEYILGKLGKKLDGYLVDFRKAMLDTNWSLIAVNSVYFISIGCGFGVATFLYIKNQITLGDLYLVFNYQSLLYGPWQQLRYQITLFGQASASMNRINELFNLSSSMKSGNQNLSLNHKKNAIEFKDVNFEYIKDKPVLKNISFALKHGEKLGIIGRTGSGKSTIIQLLTYLYGVKAGNVLLGDVNISEISHENLRDEIVLICQKSDIFSDTIKNNITLGDDRYSNDYILECINKLNLSEWFSKFQDGLASFITDSSLSEGEAQIISLIRASLRDPSIIILDEATAHLDPKTEKLITGAYKKLFDKKTAVIIAHRLQTIQSVDKVMVLSYGEIKEFGDRSDLQSNSESLYFNLLKTESKELLA